MLTILEGFGILLLRSVSCEAPGVPVVAQSAAPEPVTCEKLSDFSSQSTMQAGGWSLHNLNEGSYGDVFRRWGSSAAVGKLTTTLVGEGTMTLVLRNDYTTTAAHNHVKVLLNGDELASLSGKEEKTVHISFVDGDQLTILEGFGILLLRSVSCEAPGVPVVAQSAAPEPVTCEKLSDFSSQSTMQAGGWSLHNLNEGSYGDVFRRWGSSAAVGKLTTTLVGEGTMTLVLRNDYTTTAAHNHVKVLLNGDELASLSGKEEKTVPISFVNGDELTILEGFGILLLRSVSCEAK